MRKIDFASILKAVLLISQTPRFSKISVFFTQNKCFWPCNSNAKHTLELKKNKKFKYVLMCITLMMIIINILFYT